MPDIHYCYRSSAGAGLEPLSHWQLIDVGPWVITAHIGIFRSCCLSPQGPKYVKRLELHITRHPAVTTVGHLCSVSTLVFLARLELGSSILTVFCCTGGKICIWQEPGETAAWRAFCWSLLLPSIASPKAGYLLSLQPPKPWIKLHPAQTLAKPASQPNPSCSCVPPPSMSKPEVLQINGCK